MDSTEIEQLVIELEGRVASRKLHGEFSLGVEERLDARFAVILRDFQRHESDTTTLTDLATKVSAAAAGVGTTAPEASSRVFGGKLVHAAGGSIVQRHTSQLAGEIRELGAGVASSLTEVARLFAAQRDADERQLLSVISELVDRLSVIDHLAASVVQLERRLAMVENAQSAS